MDPDIRLRGVHKAYQGRTVLDGIDLEVHKGEIFALLGPNGAGKTTTIAMATTLVVPDSGSIEVAGEDVVAHPERVRSRIALTGQSAAVDGMLTPRENLDMFARLCGLGRRAAVTRAAELLGRFELTESADRRVGMLSGGMRRRLDLALSLVVTPQVLFLDEPTTGLDTRSRRELWDIIRTLADDGTTVFLTTQYLDEADQLAGRIAVLDAGRIVAEGSPAELKRIVGTESVQVHDRFGVLRASVATDGTVAGMRRALDELVADHADATVSVRRPSLDDVFLALTGPSASADAVDLKESA